MDSSPDESLLVLRAQCDDREALETLLRRVQPALRRYVAALVGAQDVDDVLQETLIQVCRKIAWLEDPRRFRAWTYRIASRFAFRDLRRRRRSIAVPFDEDVLDHVEAPVDAGSETSALVDELLAEATLSAGVRAVLHLHFREGLALVEVAAVLAIPLGTVKSRLAFGLRTLRQHAAARRT